MEHPSYIDNILVFLVAAVGMVFLFRRLHASPVLGYLTAGVLVGPHVIGLVQDPTEIQFLGELGVLFLLFTIGLELPVQRLMSLGKLVFGLGGLQVLVTSCILTSIIYFGFHLEIEAAVLIGSTLSLSSTAVVLNVLKDRRELGARFGRAAFSVLLFQDLAVVIILVLTTTIGVEETSVSKALFYAGLKALLAFAIIIGVGRLLLRPFYKMMAQSDNRELFMATTFLIVLGTAFFTEIGGLSMELGAFLAGMLLAETEYRHQIEADIEPFRGLLLGVFFVAVGMGIKINVIWAEAALVAQLIGLLIVLKVLILWGLSRFFDMKQGSAIRLSLLLAGGGEFCFVIFSPDVIHRLFDARTIDILFGVVIISMALTPAYAALGKVISKWLMRREGDVSVQSSHMDGELKDHVIIAGFGYMGQMIADILGERLIPYIAIDRDMARVREGRKKGLPVFYGSAQRLDVLKTLGADQARAVVVTVNQMTASIKTVTLLRRHFPDVPVCVRIRDKRHGDRLKDSGAVLVAPEFLEPSLQLASALLQRLDVPLDEIHQIMDLHRDEAAESLAEHPLTEELATA